MDTWWIDEPRLLGSRNPSDTDLERLRRDGFRVIVSLLCEKERAPRYDIARATVLGYVRHNIAVRDFSPPTLEQLEQFMKLVGGLSPGTKMIVHCEGGTGRTGTFAAAYWITKGMTASEAIMHVRKARSHAVETLEQEAVLVEFASRIQLGREPLCCRAATHAEVIAERARKIASGGLCESLVLRIVIELP